MAGDVKWSARISNPEEGKLSAKTSLDKRLEAETGFGVVNRFIGSIEEYPSYSDFPIVPEEKYKNGLFIDAGGNMIYRWDDADQRYYNLVSGSGLENVKVIDGGDADG